MMVYFNTIVLLYRIHSAISVDLKNKKNKSANQDFYMNIF